MDSGTGGQTRFAIQRQSQHFPLDDVGVVRDRSQIQGSRVFTPRRVHRLVERPFLIFHVAQSHALDQETPSAKQFQNENLSFWILQIEKKKMKEELLDNVERLTGALDFSVGIQVAVLLDTGQGQSAKVEQHFALLGRHVLLLLLALLPGQ